MSRHEPLRDAQGLRKRFLSLCLREWQFRKVSSHHVRTLINRGKIGMRYLEGGTELLKRSDVESIRVAIGTGNRQHGNGTATDED